MSGSPRHTLLVLDTATQHEAIALVEGAAVLAVCQREKPRGRDGLGAADIQELLESRGRTMSDLTGLLTVDGPGSFSGVRSGMALLQGISRGLGLPLWSASSTRARALQAGPYTGPVAVALDARRDEVYAAAYAEGGQGEELLAPCVRTAAELAEELHRLFPAGVMLVGQGAWNHRALFDGLMPGVGEAPLVQPAVGRLGVWFLSGTEGRPAPSAWPVPRYLRPCQAERERAARLAAADTAQA